MKRQRITSIVPILACVAVGTILNTACQQHQAPAPAAGPPQVAVVTLEERSVTLTTELPGRTTAYLVAEIRPQVSGLILERSFTEGATVKKGDVLYRIDPAPYQAAYDQAKAALAVAEAQLPALTSRAERLRKLADIQAVGIQDADDAEAALRQAEANAQAATAAMESARINLAYTPLKAPISGRIGRSMVTVGALVTALQPQALAVVQQLDPIYVDVTQASAELLELRRQVNAGVLSRDDDGSRAVTLLLEDGSRYPIEGRLEFRDVTVDPSTGAVTLRLVFPNPDHLLLPGMFVRALVREGVRERAILAPQQGVTRDTKGDPVALVVNAENQVEQRRLELDRAMGDRWLVNSGLEAGDRLIVEGQLNIRPGATVNAIPFAAPETEDAAPSAASPSE